MINWQKISLEDLAGFLSKEFKKEGIDLILVGGACVTIYSRNRYQSYDLDFIVYEDMKKVGEILNRLGFYEKEGYFRHKNCGWAVEFVMSPAAVGKEIITDFEKIVVATGTIKMLRAEDCVKDRLASYYHWNDKQGLDQAVDVCLEREVDFREIEAWSLKEGSKKKFERFLSELKEKSK